jgi:hypothetical protein
MKNMINNQRQSKKERKKKKHIDFAGDFPRTFLPREWQLHPTGSSSLGLVGPPRPGARPENDGSPEASARHKDPVQPLCSERNENKQDCVSSNYHCLAIPSTIARHSVKLAIEGNTKNKHIQSNSMKRKREMSVRRESRWLVHNFGVYARDEVNVVENEFQTGSQFFSRLSRPIKEARKTTTPNRVNTRRHSREREPSERHVRTDEEKSMGGRQKRRKDGLVLVGIISFHV